MKKLIISLLLIVLAATFLPAQDGGRSYCAAIGGGNWEHISNVTVGTINHSSGYSIYSDFTSFSTDLPLEEATVITVSLGRPYPSDNVGAWIDWNQDGVFNEPMITFSGTPATQFTGSIVVPPDAYPGNTRLRIRMMDGIDLQPCGGTMYGEVEDYTVSCPTLIPPPEISVQPQTISTEIVAHNSASQEILTIFNDGGRDLTWNSSISCGEIQNYCLDFNGLNQYVHIDQPILPFSLYTVEFWRYSKGTSSTGWPRMITMVQDPYHSGTYIVIEHNSPDQNTLEITVTGGPNWYKAYVDVSAYHNTWVHIALTFDGSMTTTYINGEIADQSGGTTGLFHINLTQIGGCTMPYIGLYRYFNGRMDEVRIWNVARTQQQIQDCMDSTFIEPQAGMMAYWKLDENSGSFITDESGNMIPGIIENGAAWYTPGAPLNNDIIPPVQLPVIDIVPVSGTIPPGEFADVNLTFHSGDLTPGTYNICKLLINSNDPDESELTVPLNVTIAEPNLVPVADWAVVLSIVLMVGMVVVWWWRRG